MAATLVSWPVAAPLVAGDPVTMVVTINTAADTTDWVWTAAVRRYPSGPVVVRFEVEPDPVVPKRYLLTLDEAQSALLFHGMGFDLRLNSPIDHTFLRVVALNVVRSFSYEVPEAVSA